MYEVNWIKKPDLGTYLDTPRAKQYADDALEERKGFLQQAGCKAWAGPAVAGKTRPPSPVRQQGRRCTGEIRREPVEPCPLPVPKVAHEDDRQETP